MPHAQNANSVRAVIDTNVPLSGLLWRGAPHARHPLNGCEGRNVLPFDQAVEGLRIFDRKLH